MAGALRETLAKLRERIALLASGEGADTLSEDLLAVVSLLGREPRLRNALADPGTEPRARADLVRRLFAGRIGRQAVSVLEEAVQARWARPRNLVDELEVLGAKAAMAKAEDEGRLDKVEEDLFRFSRTVVADPRLRFVLGDPTAPVEPKLAVVTDLLGGRADPTTLALVRHVVANPRGRQIDEALDELVRLAAERRSEVLAEVTVATALTPAQEQRLAAALSRLYGGTVRLHVHIDPAVVGGVRVVVGDEVVDGTVVHRLEQARRRLVG